MEEESLASKPEPLRLEQEPLQQKPEPLALKRELLGEKRWPLVEKQASLVEKRASLLQKPEPLEQKREPLVQKQARLMSKRGQLVPKRESWGEYLRPRLQGYRLEGGRYQPLPLKTDGSLESRTTGLVLKPEGYLLRLRDKETGEILLRPEEEAEARLAAEARLQLLEAELQRLRERPE